MKKLIAVFLLSFGMLQTAYGLTIEVAPLKLQASVEAFGVHLGVDGKKAVVFAGDVAEDIAHMAGVGFKKGKQVIIVTGKEVDQLLRNSVNLAGDVSKTMIILTGDIMDRAIDLTKDAVRLGFDIVIVTYKKGKTFGSVLVKTLYKLGKAPIIFITDTGKEVIEFTGKLVMIPFKVGCSTLKLFKLPVHCNGL